MSKMVCSTMFMALLAIILLSGCGGGSSSHTPPSALTTIYVGTENGLAISTDGGQTFQNRSTANGLPSNMINRVYVSGSTIYVGTQDGLAESTDGINFSPVSFFGNTAIVDVYANGSDIYVGTSSGINISHDGGSTFHTYDVTLTSTNGIFSNTVNGIAVTNNRIYAATSEGLSSIDINNPADFVVFTADYSLLADNYVEDVRVAAGKIYAGTLGGLSISAVSPILFTNYMQANFIRLCVADSKVYAATELGVVVGDVSGTSPSFVTYTKAANGLADDSTKDIFVLNNTIYVATDSGLSISTNASAQFTKRNTTHGLGSNGIRYVFVK